MTSNPADWAVRHTLHRIDLAITLHEDGDVELQVAGRAETKRTALWIDRQVFTSEHHILTPIDEVYSLLHDVIRTRPMDQSTYLEARHQGGCLTPPLDFG